MNASMIDEKNFVLMRFDDVKLIFPRSDVMTVESAANILRDESDVSTMGQLALDEEDLPVYALSKDFEFINDAQDDRRFCVCLETPEKSKQYALTCDIVEQYTVPSDMAVQVLPEFMRLLDSPIRGMIQIEKDLALECTAESMWAFVDSRECLND